jgi:molybdopterin molybdotransferase
VNSPTHDVSLKDGYAVQSRDVSQASKENPVQLSLVGAVCAGGVWEGSIHQGQAVQILSGARIPNGADAVLAEEFAHEEGGKIYAYADAEVGRNLLLAGNDIHIGKTLVEQGEHLNPMKVGLLASGGYVEIPVVRQPRVAVIATGDEVVAPGKPLPDGKLYASNLVTLAGWCVKFGFLPHTFVVPDDRQKIHTVLSNSLQEFDVVLTSGGAWKSDRDLVVHILDEIGWEKVYHRIKMGPGKAVGFGICQGKPVFLLPGGPPSNHMAFLQLTLPAIQITAGWKKPGFPMANVRLAKTLRGQIDWTQFVHGELVKGDDGVLTFTPSRQKSRLQMMAATNAIAKIPEGIDCIPTGEIILVQKLS